VNAGDEIVVDARSKTPTDISDSWTQNSLATAAAVSAAAAAATVANNNNNNSSNSNNNSLISNDDRSDRDNGEYDAGSVNNVTYSWRTN